MQHTAMPLLCKRTSMLASRVAVSLSSSGGEGQGEEAVVLGQNIKHIGAATRGNVAGNRSLDDGMGLLSPTLSSKGGEGELLARRSRPPITSKPEAMISALLYLQYYSIRNRIVMRIKRLKQPKYLVGGIVGALYFYFYFFRTFLGTPTGGHAFTLFASPDSMASFESLGALILLIVVVLAWIIPHQRAALTFTEAEVAFLFPAPISRRGLIHFKLLRSQTAILFTALLLTLVTRRAGRPRLDSRRRLVADSLHREPAFPRVLVRPHEAAGPWH